MKILPEVGHNKLFFVFARKLLNFIAILLDFGSSEIFLLCSRSRPPCFH